MPDEIREKLKPKAIELRRQGRTYDEIAESLNISKSTCSLWLRELPRPARRRHAPERIEAMRRNYWQPFHLAREQQRKEVKLGAMLGQEAAVALLSERSDAAAERIRGGAHPDEMG
ncbi:helix-turn-helix domain-containing protein [Actinomadura physcomitrii]|nr:helix-turn-helix domain-containing protein [Actinomadura physcomitrii]